MKVKIYEIDKGDILIHCGQKYHGGKKIKKGIRYILVGFITYINMHL